MANRAIYFTAKKSYVGKNNEPVVIAGIRCRFMAGRHYEVLSRGNDDLIAAIQAESTTGGLKLLTASEAIPLLEKQEETDREEREKQKFHGPRAKIPPGKPAARVE